MRKNFNELNSTELSDLLSEYRKQAVPTSYGWSIPFSIKDFYKNHHKGYYK